MSIQSVHKRYEIINYKDNINDEFMFRAFI